MKIKKNLILLAFFATTYTNAQQATTELLSPEFKKFQIGISFSTDYSFRTLKGDNEQWIKQQKVKEFPKIFYTTGINIVHNFTRNIGLETGLQYSHKGYENRVPFSNIWCGVGLPNSKIPNYKEVYNYHYIDVPLAVNFSIGNGKVRLVSSLGLTTNVLLKYTIRSVYPSETKHKSKTTSCYRPNNNTIILLIQKRECFQFK